MTLDEILQGMISEPGESQDGRSAEELWAHHADTDERTPADMLSFARAFARFVHHHRAGASGEKPIPGDMSPFFRFTDEEAASLLADESGTVPPHLALLITFLKLRELPRELLNRTTEKHLRFYLERVLRFEPRAAVPDRAHVLVELKKNAGPVVLRPDHALSAGKDAKGELIYVPVRETVVGGAVIDDLRSVFTQSAVLCAPVASSGDGVGGPLPAGQSGFLPFGHPGLLPSAIGFALSSPVLRMKEGSRTITLSLAIAGASLDPWAVAGKLEAFLTGEKGWMGPLDVAATLTAGGRLELAIGVPGAAGAVIDHAPAVHGQSFAARAPVVQVLLRTDAGADYRSVRDLSLTGARIRVRAEGVTSLSLESDTGKLDPKKTFLPFGPEPVKGSRFVIGCAEALSKRLSSLELRIRWHDLPDSLKTRYAKYDTKGIDDDSFTVSVALQDAGTTPRSFQGKKLFDRSGEAGVLSFDLGASAGGGPSVRASVPIARQVHALGTAGSAAARRVAADLVRRKPVLAPFLADPSPAAPAEARSGFLTLSLEQGFFHTEYRQIRLRRLLDRKPGAVTVKEKPLPDGGKQLDVSVAAGEPVELPDEPYTPAIEGISLSYEADSGEVDIAKDSKEELSGSDVRFFHVDCFGQRQEHGYLRARLGFLASGPVPLFPTHDREGELLLGVARARAGDSVSVLFQVAEGSADPDVERPVVEWSVLCDNHWRKLGEGELVEDTTGALRASGVVVFVLPREATTDNTLLPAGRIWLRATVDRAAESVSRLVSVAANAVEVRLRDRVGDAAHLAAPLPAGKIAKLLAPIASVKSIQQPHPSFGGRPAEPHEALATRAAERLRHKDRCITPWDYERSVLDAFPSVHRVKCIPHATDGAWMVPGHVLLVVIPDLRGKSADLHARLRPRVDAATLSSIQEHVEARKGMQVVVKVKNPVCQKVRLDFKVKLRRGFAWNTYRALLEEELIAFLSPWAHDADRPISFGGHVHRSVLLDFVEERPYVEYVTDFRLYSGTGTLVDPRDLAEVRTARPDAILVSDDEHTIGEAP